MAVRNTISEAAIETEKRYASIDKLDMTRDEIAPEEKAYVLRVYNKEKEVDNKMALTKEGLEMILELGKAALNNELFKNEDYNGTFRE